MNARFVTRSRRGDLLLCAALAACLVAASLGLRVYHSIVVAELDLVRFTADGERAELSDPEQCLRASAARRSTEAYLDWAESCLRSHVESLGPSSRGDRFEATIRYGENSLILDRRREIHIRADERRGL